MKKIGKFNEMLDKLEYDDIEYINQMINVKMGEDCDTQDFFDEVENWEWEEKDNSPNIYIKYDRDNEMNNLFYGVNVYTGGPYNKMIDGPEEYKSIGFSFVDFVRSDIYICPRSLTILGKEPMNIIASIVWEITRYGNTEEERMDTEQILEGSYE